MSPIKNLLIVFSFILVNCAHANVPLEQKLKNQWSLYDQAREALLVQVQKTSLPPEQRVISRDAWEKILAPESDLAFTKQDLSELKQSQEQRIKTAYQKALNDSVIDLDLIRKASKAEAFCADFPKGGMLHIHDSGTLDQKTVHSLLLSKNPQLEIPSLLKEFNDPSSGSFLYPDEIKWLSDHANVPSYLELSMSDQPRYEEYFFLPPGKHDFKRFEAIFAFLPLIADDVPAYKKILWDFAKRASDQKVIYVELRESVMEEFADLMDKIEKDLGVTIRVNRAFIRTRSLNDIEKGYQNFMSNPKQPWVVGIDFLANEEGNSALDKGQLIYGGLLHANLNGQSKLHRTMHSGEIGDVRNPRDAIIMGVERLGHGVNLEYDLVTLEYAARNKVPVEINLSSNLQLTSVVSIATHPFLNYLRLGLPVSLSTDDEGIFNTDINHECELAITQSNVTYAELKQMSVNSIDTSFAADTDKKKLRAKLDKSLVEFEKKWIK